MKIKQIRDIVRKDVPIYYRRLFNGVLEIEVMGKNLERQIDFTIETLPTGMNQVSVTIAEPVDYPLVPLMKELKQFISDLDENGGLPG
ncbi:conserved hypothetical protein [Treponema primitia ZAS-2]|uniref:Uncharacterized protein n=1 Tax=Treponema primitia (strain ATCC BAA-887 / DSM 12427 / ZAS-2) TaxID=545694 RepID=F5YKK8_TREPZ|nr:hypothetical protein [Treponema primitia]AEF85430.1 conserved hypothetical protein [Treponema primitia ZAS-2]